MENTIRVERAKVRITQKELADRVNVSRQTIHAIETGKFIPRIILAMKIARFFNKPVESIFKLGHNERVN